MKRYTIRSAKGSFINCAKTLTGAKEIRQRYEDADRKNGANPEGLYTIHEECPFHAYFEKTNIVNTY